MTTARTHRAAKTVAALAAATAGLLMGGGASVAHAAPAGSFGVSPGFDRTVPLRTNGAGTAYRPLALDVYSEPRDELTGVRVAVNGAALNGFAELNLPAGCAYTSADHLHESCSLGTLPQGSGSLSVGVRAAAGAKTGEQGRVLFTVTAANAEEVSGDPSQDAVGVTVGDGPDLTINDLGRSIHAAPAAYTTLPLLVSNAGTQDANGVVLIVHDQYDVATVLGNHSNCLYEAGQRGVFCTFPDAVVKPGETFRLSDPVTLAVPAGAHGDQIQYGDGLTGDDWIGKPDGTPGTGAPVSLVPADAPQKKAVGPADATHDIDTYNNLYYTDLSTGNVTDVAAVGGDVDAVVGRDTAVTFGVRNTGTTPITTVDSRTGFTVQGDFRFPTNVSVLSTPKGCTTFGGGPEGLSAYPLDPGPGQQMVDYQCPTTRPLPLGGQIKFTFHIKLLKSVAGQYAGVFANALEDPTSDGMNDTARLHIHTVKAGASPSPSPSFPVADAPAGGQGGQLAATGGGSGTMVTVFGAALAVLLGTVGVLAARRRRVAASR